MAGLRREERLVGPTDSASSERRQLALVFDLNKCMGCQTCSIACKMLWTRDDDGAEGTDYMWWCSVNTMPGRGYPRDWEKMGGGYRNGQPHPGIRPAREDYGGGWDFNHEEVYYSGRGPAVHLAPRGPEPDWGPNWDEDQGAGEWPNSYFFYLPRICNHCSRPVCLETCPEGALIKRDEDGLVLRDEDRCRGQQRCVEACPYKKIFFNSVRGVSQHCIGCFPRLEQGVAPACARQCPGRAVFVGFLDDADSPVQRLVREWGVALPLHAEYGTSPNVFYVPPLSAPRLREDGSPDEDSPRIPLAYLEGLFGPRVGEALATLKREMVRTRAGERSELMDLLTVYHWNDLFGPFTRDPGSVGSRAAE
jgi:ethylbenzene hydroxylase subunit beta/complex iron-sulfur molybdoenzyme family reductase subunit beta